MALVVADLSLPLAGSGHPLVIAIAKPKNRRFMGRSQFRLVSDPGTIAWIRWAFAGLPPESLLWPSSPVMFRRVFDWGLAGLSLPHHKFTPACLRAGGATQYFSTGMEISALKYRGGWAAERSVACYVQEAMACLVWNQLPAHVSQNLAQSVSADRVRLDLPPQCPWPCVFKRRLRLRPAPKLTRP